MPGGRYFQARDGALGDDLSTSSGYSDAYIGDLPTFPTSTATETGVECAFLLETIVRTPSNLFPLSVSLLHLRGGTFCCRAQ